MPGAITSITFTSRPLSSECPTNGPGARHFVVTDLLTWAQLPKISLMFTFAA